MVDGIRSWWVNHSASERRLMADFLAGWFMLTEDQFGVGDIVDLGEASGTVEKVSIRVTRLRDVFGVVWYVPNGTVARVGNMSQNWSRAVVDVTVAYHEDLARVERVLGEVAHVCRRYRARVVTDQHIVVLGREADAPGLRKLEHEHR